MEEEPDSEEEDNGPLGMLMNRVLNTLRMRLHRDPNEEEIEAELQAQVESGALEHLDASLISPIFNKEPMETATELERLIRRTAGAAKVQVDTVKDEKVSGGGRICSVPPPKPRHR